MHDIYFEEKYGKLYEQIENGRSIVWKYEGVEGEVSHQFLLREIPINSSDNKWYDIVTPYGYGGPVVNKLNDDYKKSDLISSFYKSFEQYCMENKIVSEFVRFHPIIKNADDFGDIYHAECIRNTLGTNLRDYDSPTDSEFSKGCRKNIRKALNQGISWRVTPRPEQIDEFKEIYYSTMDRNNATDYYYFGDDYFSNCLKWFKDNIVYVEAIFEEKTIAAGVYFIYDKTIHIHLSGTLSEYLFLSPAYILRYAVTVWGKENGYEMIHHGGGRSNLKEDSLYLFKKQFAKNTEFEFFVGKKIWNKEKYDELCRIKGADENSSYFPAYRE